MRPYAGDSVDASAPSIVTVGVSQGIEGRPILVGLGGLAGVRWYAITLEQAFRLAQAIADAGEYLDRASGESDGDA